MIWRGSLSYRRFYRPNIGNFDYSRVVTLAHIFLFPRASTRVSIAQFSIICRRCASVFLAYRLSDICTLITIGGSSTPGRTWTANVTKYWCMALQLATRKSQSHASELKPKPNFACQGKGSLTPVKSFPGFLIPISAREFSGDLEAKMYFPQKNGHGNLVNC